MSRYYEMSVEISGYRPENVQAIQKAAEEEWPFEDWDDSGEQLTALAKDNLCGGESAPEVTGQTP